MKKLILSLLALVVLLAAGCPVKPTPVPTVIDAGPVPVVTVPDATPPLDAAPPTPPPAPPSSADAGPPVPMTPVGSMCFNLAALGCAEGKAANCVAVTQKAIDSGLTKVPLACLSTAKTLAAARACGFVSCKP